MGEEHAGPLSGVRVLELSIALTGPYIGALFADQGADVVKVERPDIGDIMRWIGPSVNGLSAVFRVCNRGKQSIAVDVRTAVGREIALELAAQADVVIQNFRPGVAQRLGLGYDDVVAINPDVVYLSLTGFGEVGPYRDRSAYDTVIQAYGGVASSQSGSDGAPIFLQQVVADKVTALYASQAVTAALLARANGRGGQHVHVSMVDAVVSFLWADATGNEVLLDSDGSQPSSFTQGFKPFRFIDGWGVVTPISDSDFTGMCRALEAPGSDDPRLATADLRNQHRPLMAEIMKSCYAGAEKLTVEEATARFEAEDVPFAMIVPPHELPDDPHAIEMGLFVEADDPVVGRTRIPRHPALFDSTPAQLAGPAPALGQHTTDVLGRLGRSDQESELREARIIAGG
ncbi:crotonobetainyl-CoA:carnitine CoA-transferase CaiB-like acyl-CoA transferase [Mycobacterium sp. BK086]|uniref:CaiB/BaiF CoA transferase family protein n=1 Tax=Mycobacterium sp. BK086 TaxID=2512165 RepID=UPI00105E783F|nr:CoA transferase [Mycobacterium sp. BK086]TDO18665.1 crotonobetainyl-CoA:carnitine CoA-transferase CaiB-like acyl-CoA transferase [Mycobacterium sp. BK086]